MSINSTQAWNRVQQVHTRLADWSVSSVRTVKYKTEDHLKLGISNRKTGQTASCLIDAQYNLVIDDTDREDIFNRLLARPN